MNERSNSAALDARLREELGRLARAPVPSVAESVLQRLPARRPRSRRVAPAAAAALAAVLLVWAVPALRSAGEALRGDAVVPATAQPRAPWFALGAPLAPEAALREEARRLVDDTRRTADSLRDRLPLSGSLAALLARQAQ